MCPLQPPVTGACTLLDRSYRRWQKNFMSFLETIAFTGILGCQAGLAKQRDWLHEIRLLNMVTIFMTFCLTYYWLLTFVFRYKEALLKLLMI